MTRTLISHARPRGWKKRIIVAFGILSSLTILAFYGESPKFTDVVDDADSDEWTNSTSRDPKNEQRLYMVEPQCQHDNPDFVVFVQTSPTHIENRQRIRHTWGNLSHYQKYNVSVCVIFSLGLNEELAADLVTESKVTRDLLIQNFVDSYNNLTLKSIRTMSWISRSLKSSFIMKSDDDVLLDIFSWIRIIENLKRTNVTCCMVCFVWIHAPVWRGGKYIVSREQYKFDFYPMFCSGAAYLMTRDAMDAVIEGSKHVPQIPRDDPYLSGMVAELVNIPLLHVPSNSYRFFKTDDAKLSERPLLYHNATESVWFAQWHKLILQESKVGNKPSSHRLTSLPEKHKKKEMHIYQNGRDPSKKQCFLPK